MESPVGPIESVPRVSSNSHLAETAEGDSDSQGEVGDHDRSVLREEEEREKLLSVPIPEERRFPNPFATQSRDEDQVGIERKEKRKQRRRQRRQAKRKGGKRAGEEGELMFEMEEGGFKDTGSDSSLSDLNVSSRDLQHKRSSRNSKFRRFLLMFGGVVVLFITIFLGAVKTSKTFRSKNTSKLLSNGSSLFGPTTILISLDGFRADYLNRGLSPTLNSFITEGISPEYMLPSFPSVTFPNHFTMVTGLYPESHGLVGNTFWDPNLMSEFYYTDPAHSMRPEWWPAEPLWVTAEHQGVRTAIHMWPGSEAHIPDVEPTYMDKFNGTEALPRKVDRVLGFLDLPGDHELEPPLTDQRRPQLILFYVPNVDSDGHKFGPNSTEIRRTISNVDNMLADLFTGLRNRNLTDIVNVIVVSDHGMATTSTDRLIQLDDIVDLELIDHIDGWPLQGLRPKDERDIPKLHKQLLQESANNPNFDVFLRGDMPERWHFSHNDRIAPLWIIPKAGWAIATKDDFDVEQGRREGKIYLPRGIHGYDNEHPLMRAIFVAKGPSFPHIPNSRVPVFQNIEVYNIICDTLSISPSRNNGTLRLPMKPIGLHSDANYRPAEAPDDPPSKVNGHTVTSAALAQTSGALRPDQPKQNSPGPSASDGESAKGEEAKSWWQFMKDKIDAAKAWADGIIHPDSPLDS